MWQQVSGTQSEGLIKTDLVKVVKVCIKTTLTVEISSDLSIVLEKGAILECNSRDQFSLFANVPLNKYVNLKIRLIDSETYTYLEPQQL